MSNISITNLQSPCSKQFFNDENFISEIPENSLASINGGFTVNEMISNIIKSIGESLTTMARMG